MEIIPQHVYTYDDGLPSYKSGEWPGSRPSHFTGSKLILKPIEHPEKEFRICHAKHFPQKYSDEYKYKKLLKYVPPFIHEDIYKPTKRILKPLTIEPAERFGKRVFPQKEKLYSTTISPFLPRKRKVKKFIPYMTEYGIESIMNRKKRILSLGKKRNHMKVCKPGDKNYNCVENSPDYYKIGGLIPGSTQRINYKKSTRKGENKFYQTINLDIKVLDRNKIWAYRETQDSINSDRKYVENLSLWENKFLDEEKKDNKKKEDKDKDKDKEKEKEKEKIKSKK